MNVEKSFVMAQRLKDLRERRGLSHARLAQEIAEKYGVNISKDSLINYEVSDEFHQKAFANNGMRVSTLRILADFYNVSTDFLVGASDVETPDESIQGAIRATGLNESAVQRLARMNTSEIIGEKNSQLLLYEVSQLVLSPHFLRVLTILARLRSGARPKESEGTIEWFDHLDNAKKELSHCPGYSVVDSETVRTAMEFEASKIFNKIVEEVQEEEQNGE